MKNDQEILEKLRDEKITSFEDIDNETLTALMTRLEEILKDRGERGLDGVLEKVKGANE